ncbi:hemagglutinin repeat-containing protein [Acinetobacter guillouiae]|uniref:hemagglutinin repeat-containing protein n=1 Tax=Acinetobacter guillouiae TaxID=106649 RepID=UPI003AF723C6
MNKNRYRVIFSQVRGMFIAVAEIVKSRTKTAGQSHSIGEIEIEDVTGASSITYKKLNPVNFAVVSLLGAAIYTLPMATIAESQIVADRSAPNSQQATILNSSNGLTQVNIQTPSAGGVSRNTYTQFDVGQEGAILNNARNNTQTQLGGWVQGNPWLAKGEAKVILNEVNSSNPSQLKGYLEVAGKQAQVVIANPSGLICDGCGVINADRFTLTTGQAVMHQGYLDSFRVREGQVTIEGKGLNGSLTPYTDIYARALNVNAGLYANELKTVLGQNDINVQDQNSAKITPTTSTTSSPTPNFALDVGKLGGMYAGKIYLVGTEKGLGVRNAGSLNATTGQMHLNANGDLTNTGNMIANKDQILIQASNVKNSGNISSTQQQIQIQADNIQNTGLIATRDEIKLNAQGKIDNNEGVINAGRIDFTAQNLTNNKGKIEQTGQQQLDIAAKNLDNTQGLIGQATVDPSGTGQTPGGTTSPSVTDPEQQSSAQDSSKVEVAPTDLTPKTFEAGNIQIAQDIANAEGAIVNNAEINLRVEGSIKNNGGEIQLPELQFNGQYFDNQQGKLTANVVNITAQQVDNQKGVINANQSFDLTAQQLNNDQGRLQSAKTLNLNSAEIDNRQGQILAADALTLNSANTNNTQGVIGSVNADAKLSIQTLDNRKGEISAQNVHLTGQSLNNQLGTIQSKTADLNINIDQIDNGTMQDSAGNLIAAQNLKLNAQQLQSTGQIYAGNSVDLTVNQLQQHGQLAAQNKIKVQANTIVSDKNAVWVAGLDQDGKLSNTDATLNIDAQQVQLAGKILAGAELQIKAAQTADLSQSESQAKNINIATTQLNTSNAKIIADEQLDLTATQSIDNEKGQYSAKQVNLNTAQLNNNQGLIQHTGKNDFILDVANRIDNNAGQIISNATGTVIKTNTLNSVAGEILHAGDQQLKITAQNLQGQQGKIQSNSHLQLDLGIANLDQALTSAQNIDLNAVELSHQQGQLLQSDANGQLKVNVAQTLNNSSGVISAAGSAQLNVTQLNNNAGKLLVDKQLGIKADDINNTQGTVYTDDSLNIIAKHGINNQQGILAAKQAVYVKAQSLNNTEGTVQSEQSNLDLSITGALDNQRGKLLSNQDISIQSLSLNNASGTIFSNQGLNLDIDGGIENQSGTIAANNNISVNAQSLDNTSGQIRSEKQHLNIITQQNLNNDSGILVAAKNVAITAQDLFSQNGQIQAGQHADLTVQSLDNTAGTLYAEGQLKLNALAHINNQDGVIAANQGFNLNAASLSNNAGKLIAQQSAMQLDIANELSNIKGEISAAQDLTMNSGHWNNVEGKAVAGQKLHLNTATLDNHLGVIYAQDQSKIVATGQVNNTSGVIASKQIDLTSQSLLNDLGKIRAEQGSLNLSVNNELSNLSGEIFAQQEANLKAQQINNQKGKIQSILKTKIETNTLDNQSGTIYTQDQLQLLAQSAIQNQQGTIAAQKDLQINSTDLNNEQGIIQSEQGRADLTVQGALNNHQGELFASKGLNVVAQGIDNRLGQISSLEKLNLDSQLRTLNNESGKILADQILLKTGLLNNNSGLIQSNSELSIDTNQHDLLNQNSGARGGILSQGKLNLTHVQQLLNDNGILASADDVEISAQQLSNQKGQINSQGNLTIAQQQSGGVLNNQGQIQALKNIQIHTDQLNNSGQGSHIVAAEDLSIQAQVIDNRQNLDDTILGGLDAQNIQLNARELNNQSGGIRASKDASLLIQQNFDNQQGSVTSLGTLLIGDSQKTLNINNTQGELIAQNRLAISANNLINQGKIISLGDAELNLKQSYTHQQGDELSANGLLKINSEHDFINQSVLSAGKGLTVNAQNILNQTGASISSIETHLIANDVLHNQGLINGELTHLKANLVWNDGAKIYGDHIAIQAQTLNNKSNGSCVGAEQCSARSSSGAVIASRGDIDLGIDILNNQAGGLINSDSKDNAWILSMGQLNVGGSLDGNYQAQGQAQLINNRSATIESQGNMRLTAKEIQNLNDNFSVHQVLESSKFVHSYEDNRHPGIDVADLLVELERDGGFYWLVLSDGRRLRTYNIFEYDKESYVPEVLTSTPGQILSGGNMLLQSDHIVNDQSQILAAGVLKVEGTDIDNKAYLANKLIQFKNPKKWFYDSGRKSSMAYAPADETQPYELSGLYGGNKVIAVPTTEIKDKTNDTVQVHVTGSKQAQALEYAKQQAQQKQVAVDAGQQVNVKQSENAQNQQLGELDPNGSQQQVQPTENQKVDSAQQLNALDKQVSGVDKASDYEVRSVEQKTITLPSNALYSTTKDSQAQYLVETDPAFSQYKKWLSSDYMLSALGLDPANQQKRLGDGFYEQRLVQDQIAQLTGHRFLSGYGSDEEQYKALMNNGLTFAKSYNLRPGIALTAAQIAQLTSDIVWLEEKTITLADGTSSKVLVPQVYVRARPGDLKGDGTLISADQVQLNMNGDVLNQATIAGREALIINANNVNQLAGRMEANRVGIKTQNDLNNIGSQIVAKEAASFDIGGNLNVNSTLTSNNKQKGRSNYGFTAIDRKAGIYVGNNQTSSVEGSDNLKTTLNIKVAGNTTLKGAEILNSNGSTILQTQGDVNLATLQTERINNSYKNNKNYDFSTTQQDVGNQIVAKGDLTLTGKNIDITGSQVSSVLGRTTLSAEEQLNIQEGRARSTVEHADEVKKKSFLSSKTTQTYRKDKSDEGIASTVDGKQVILDAKNIKIQGSKIISDELTQIQAKENVSITAAENQYLNESEKRVKKSGFTASLSGGVASIGYGKSNVKAQQDNQSTELLQSKIISTQGNTNILAGKDLTAEAAILGAGKDLNLQGANVNLNAGYESNNQHTNVQSKSSGFSVGLTYSPGTAAASTYKKNADNGQFSDSAVGQVMSRADAVDKALMAAKTPIVLTAGNQKSNQSSNYTNTQAVVTQAEAKGNLNIIATGGNINSQGAQLAAEGNALLHAKDNINLNYVTDRQDQTANSKQSGFSVDTRNWTAPAGVYNNKDKGQGNVDKVTGTQLSVGGKTTLQTEKGDINILGSSVASQGDVKINAANDVNIKSAQSSQSQSQSSSNKGIGSAQISDTEQFYGYMKGKNQSNSQSIEQQRSQVRSLEGNVNIQAGNNYNQQVADIVANKDINITAKQISVLDDYNTGSSDSSSKDLKVGVFKRVSSPILDLLGSADKAAKGNAADDRTQALQGLAAGAQAYQSYSDIKGGSVAKAEAGIGFSTSKNQQSNSYATSQPNQISAGGNVNLTSTAGDIHLQNTQVKAKETISLDSAKNILLESGQSQEKAQGKNSNAGLSVGVGASVGAQTGAYIYAEAGYGKGSNQLDRNTHSQTTLEANKVSLTSKGDTTLAGAKATANRIDADVGGKLSIISQQDQVEQKIDQSGAGARLQASLGTAWQASGNLSNSSANGSSNSVNQQAGLFAGDGGYHVKADQVDLKGGAIVSTAKKENNDLTANSLTFSDINNKSSYDATSVSLSGGTRFGEETKTDNQGNKYTNNVNWRDSTTFSPSLPQHESDKDSSVTRSTLSEGNITIGGQATTTTALGIHSDASTAHRSVDTLPNLQEIIDKQKTVADATSTIAAATRTYSQNQQKQAEQEKKNTEQTAIAELQAKGGEDWNKYQNSDNEAEKQELLKNNSPSYKQASETAQDWGMGGDKSRAVNAVAMAVTGALGGQTDLQVAANALAPYAANIIGKELGHGEDKNKAAQLAAHAILGAALAYVNGGNPAAGGSAAVASEAAADYLTNQYKDKKEYQDVNGEFQANLLPEDVKTQIRDLTAAIGAVVGGTVGDSAFNAQLAGVVGQNAVENNFLSPEEYKRKVELINKAQGGANGLNFKALAILNNGSLNEKEAREFLALVAMDKYSDQLLKQYQKDPNSLTPQQKYDLVYLINQASNGDPVKAQQIYDSGRYGTIDPYTGDDLNKAITKAKQSLSYANSTDKQLAEAAEPALFGLSGKLGTVIRYVGALAGSYNVGQGTEKIVNGKYSEGAVQVIGGVLTIVPAVSKQGINTYNHKLSEEKATKLLLDTINSFPSKTQAGKSAAMIGAFDPVTGKVAIGSSNAKISADVLDPRTVKHIETQLGVKIGEFTSFCKNVAGACAEVSAADKLVRQGVNPANIQFTIAVRPKVVFQERVVTPEAIVKTCDNCNVTWPKGTK